MNGYRLMICPSHTAMPTQLTTGEHFERTTGRVITGKTKPRWERREDGWTKVPTYQYAICHQKRQDGFREVCGEYLRKVEIRDERLPHRQCDDHNCKWAKGKSCMCACWGKNHGKNYVNAAAKMNLEASTRA